MFNKKYFKGYLSVILSFITLLGIIIFSFFVPSPNQKPNQSQLSSIEVVPSGVVVPSEIPESTSIPITPIPIIQEQTINTQVPIDYFDTIIKDTFNQIKIQNEVDRNLLAELQSGTYSLKRPLIVINPYNISPLTGLVLFSSPEPTNISLHVDGIDELTTVDFTFTGFTTEHIIPVYGLYPDKANLVTIHSIDENGVTDQFELIMQTEPLPIQISEIIIQTDLSQIKLYEPGFNFGYAGEIKTAFDANGNFRWFLNTNFIQPGIYTSERFVFVQGTILEGKVLISETNPLGRIYKIYYAPYGVHHDISFFNDSLLFTGSTGETIEDLIYEIDTKTGAVINTLDLKTILQRSRKTSLAQGNPDWFHNNAVTWNTAENKIIISGRNQSSIVKLSWPEGKVDWILSSPEGWLPMFEKYLLTPIGENFEWPYGQHAPEVLPDQDNNPDTIDILLFDNGNNRFDLDEELQRQIRNNEITPPDLYSRMVQYRINEKNNTVEQIWQFGKEYGDLLFAVRVGDANLLPNGNRLGLFNIQSELLPESPNNATFFEVTENSKIVWLAQTTTKMKNDLRMEYRLTRMEIYNQSANDLQIGTPVINLIPQEILEQYGIQQ